LGRLLRLVLLGHAALSLDSRAPSGQTPRMADDPLALFDAWFAEAKTSEPNDPDAMALATADSAGNPSVRMVLLKGYGSSGFTFFTNEESNKGRELGENPHAALLFHWKSLRRQIRIEGSVVRVPPEEADAYFATRSRESQIGAWASKQSHWLESRAIFEKQYEETKDRFQGCDIPRPPHWGGYRVIPLVMEFWQDRPHRLHERRVFLAQQDGDWAESLAYP
jgi:pyridoxamine 5'-phosphate oxidase